ncbi:hypothetical protein CPLU01_08850 [Colletotrichum plurivorum]|uniref:Uncharacterized protein n=1 Tax=Colletotrichum plurivorum TaxID=2175906 RepID=A0A8H6KAK8_9PEZI|nr:hypothetical protein CPLU01_08850 [Colletotrichum plurivorum]
MSNLGSEEQHVSVASSPTHSPDNNHQRSPSPLSLADPLPQPDHDEQPASPVSDTSEDSKPSPSEIKAHEDRLLEQARIEQQVQDLEARHRALQPSPTDPPPLIIGAPLGKNLTPLEAASRLVAQWEAIHAAADPSNAGPILDSLTRARANLAAIQEQPELKHPELLASKREAAVSSRIAFLESSLEDSVFPPERANIAAAVSLYRSSAIPYSANWALIYAGHLVDFAPSYASFTGDRAERLDRYAALHGPGWLWFEPPLAPGDAPLFSARRGTWLPETDTSYDMGHYSVTMTFRRMKNLNHRSRRHRASEGAATTTVPWPLPPSDAESEPETTKEVDSRAPKPPSSLRRSRSTRHPGMTGDGGAPTLHFRLLLDSGATLPMLYDRDATALGIYRESYAAVSRVAVETASDSNYATWLYEMQVSVSDTFSCASLVSSSSPVWPAERHALGGVLPVMVRATPPSVAGAGLSFSAPRGRTGAYAETANGETTFLQSMVYEAEGRDYGRLSGLLPFKCCYLQSTPGLRTMWLGEDRRDVLGAHKMPGQMRWEPGSGRVCDPGQPRHLWKGFCGDEGGTSKPDLLRMAHAAGPLRMVDFEEDGWRNGRSEVVVVDKLGTREKHVVEPRTLESQQRVKRQKVDGYSPM